MEPLMVAAGGLRADVARLEAWGADLANAATPGFLALIPASRGYPVGTLARLGGGPSAWVSPPMAQGTAAETTVSLSPSSVHQTGIATDLAIVGPGFFTVRTPQGVAYTRDGRFRPSPQGWLVDAAGDPVLTTAGTPLAVGAGPFTVAADGTVTQGGQVLGRLALAELAPAGVVSLGQSLYQGVARPAAGVTVIQGALNGSNVTWSVALPGLLAAQAALQSDAAMAHAEAQRLNQTTQLGLLP